MAAWPVRLHARVSAAEMAAVAAALPNRELRQSAFFLLSLYPWELRPDQRSMNRTFFQFDRRLSAGVGAHVRATCRDRAGVSTFLCSIRHRWSGLGVVMTSS